MILSGRGLTTQYGGDAMNCAATPTLLSLLFLSLTAPSGGPPQPREVVTDTFWIFTLLFLEDGKLVAAPGANSDVGLWDVESGKLQGKLKGHRDHVFRIIMSPDGKRLASVGEDGTLRLWEKEKNVAIIKVNGGFRPGKEESYGACGAAFPPDGKW